MGDHESTVLLHGVRAFGAVIAHARQDRGNTHGTCELSGSFKGDIGTGFVGVDARTVVEQNSACGRDAKMMRAGTNVERSLLQHFTALSLFDTHATDFL